MLPRKSPANPLALSLSLQTPRAGYRSSALEISSAVPSMVLCPEWNGEGDLPLARSLLVLPGLGTGCKVNRRTGRLTSRFEAVLRTGIALVRESDAVPLPRRTRCFCMPRPIQSLTQTLCSAGAYDAILCNSRIDPIVSEGELHTQPRHHERELAIAWPRGADRTVRGDQLPLNGASV